MPHTGRVIYRTNSCAPDQAARFATPPAPGDRLPFLGQAHYSMVKTSTFNGVPLPAIVLWDSGEDRIEIVRQFGWEEFRDRLS